MITIVSGFQRCGTSLMLQMLSAGGMRVFHDEEMGYPSFETNRILYEAGYDAWLPTLDGQAVKWLEPLRAMPTTMPIECRVLWMRRDYREQGKSSVKFLRAVGGLAIPSQAARAMARGYANDEPRALDAWGRRGSVRVVRFESLLSAPLNTALAVSRFLGVPLNTEAMAAQVRPRPAECLPGFLELDLMRERDAAVTR